MNATGCLPCYFENVLLGIILHGKRKIMKKIVIIGIMAIGLSNLSCYAQEQVQTKKEAKEERKIDEQERKMDKTKDKLDKEKDKLDKEKRKLDKKQRKEARKAEKEAHHM